MPHASAGVSSPTSRWASWKARASRTGAIGLGCLLGIGVVLSINVHSAKKAYAMRSGMAVAVTTATLTPATNGDTAKPPKSSRHWAADISTGTQVVGAAALIIGGILGYRRFLKERPYASRTDVTVVPKLFTADGGQDVLQVRIAALNRGRARLKIVWEADGDVRPFVAVYAVTALMLQDGLPKTDTEWADHGLWAEYVFENVQMIETGETAGEQTLVPLVRRANLVAYRVEFWLSVEEESGRRFSWGDTAFVPVSLVPHPVHNGSAGGDQFGEEGAEGAEGAQGD